MAHNAQSINGKTPDAAGNVNLGVADLTDVTLTGAAAGEVLVLDNGVWKNAPQAGSGQYLYLANLLAAPVDAYPVTDFSAGQPLYFPTQTTYNTATITIDQTFTGWTSELTLPAGVWSISAQTSIEFSSVGYLTWGIYDATNTLISNMAFNGADLSLYGNAPSSAAALYSINSAATIYFKIINTSGVNTLQPANAPALCGSILMRKVG